MAQWQLADACHPGRLCWAPAYKKEQKQVLWDTKSRSGYFTNIQEDLDSGVYTADFNMPPRAGASDIITAELRGDDGALKTEYKEIVVLPGEPAKLTLNATGEVFIAGHKGLRVEVDVHDKNGNQVVDGTSVNFQVEGEAVIAEYEPATKNGRATAYIKGLQSPSKDTKLIVTVDQLRKEHAFEVLPLELRFVSVPSTFDTNTTYSLAVKLSEPGGAPVGGVDVHFVSTFGKFKNTLVATAGNGEAVSQFHSGFGKRRGELRARVGRVFATAQLAEVKPPKPGVIDALNAMVVGDKSSAGYANYERYDGAKLGLRYETQTPFTLSGQAGKSYVLKLGDLSEPNLAPVAAYSMKREARKHSKLPVFLQLRGLRGLRGRTLISSLRFW